MISFVCGRLDTIGPDYVIVEAGGVGYRIGMPISAIGSLPPVGEQVRVPTYMHVKEDGIFLFGFMNEEQKRLFENLITVAGVGPSGALRLLSVFTEGHLAAIIAGEEVATLLRVPGIGNKTAQRIVLELKDKMRLLVREHKEPSSSARALSGIAEDAIEGLVGLGYARAEARKATEAALRDLGDRATVTAVIKEALKALTNR